MKLEVSIPLNRAAAELGRKGGKSKSARKLRAMRKNLKLAWDARKSNGQPKKTI